MTTQTKRGKQGTSKTATAPAAPKGDRGRQARPIDRKTLEAIVLRLRSRKTTLREESHALGFATNPALRRRLLTHLGSKGEYRKVVSVGRRKGKGDKGVGKG